MILANTDLALVHEVEDRHQVSVGDALQVQQWVAVLVSLQDSPEKWGAGRYDNFMGFNLICVTNKGHVKQFLVLSQLGKSGAEVTFKVIPL